MILKIISAEKVLFEGEASSVTLPGEMGQFTVLPHNAALMSTLTKCNIKYVENNEVHEVMVEGGIVDVNNDVVSVCIY